ncbi:MAG: hypothetical protein H6713_42775 [Myxococcales bacterium]|nr:hypothetical protein [Myxococcales bacterium]MCB9756689.1 hypothetical protein [Myxococcales bacterium]
MELSWRYLEKSFRGRWPRIDPTWLCWVVKHLRERDGAAVEALVEDALARAPADAASVLMGPVTSAWPSVDERDRDNVLQALEILIRAGGDPGPALPILGAALGDRRTANHACSGLRCAALRGWSVAPVRDQLARAQGERHRVRALQRLDELGRRGLHDELRALDAVYREQPVGNLFEAIGLLEELLLSETDEAVALARRALTRLRAAGRDLLRSWLALLPVLRRRLATGDADQRARAARAVGQLRYAFSETEESEDQARRLILPLLDPLVAALCEHLGDAASHTATMAAETLEILVGLGATLSRVRAELDAALDDERVSVRSPCARALSRYLVRAGEEAALPPGTSHRRTYAAAETPLPGERATVCPRCQQREAVVIYRHHDRGQTWDNTLIESMCSACGVFTVRSYGY